MGGMTNLTTIPLTGIQFRISAGDYSATVTELGGGLREFRYRDQPVITQYEPDELPPAGAGQPERLHGRRISSSTFAVLGISPLLGRAFTEDEDRLGGTPVVAISRATR